MADLRTAREVAKLAGVNYNTLLLWLRRGWIEALPRDNPKHEILFKGSQAQRVRALASMKRKHAAEWQAATQPKGE